MRTWTTDEDTKLVDALMEIRLSGKYTNVYNNKFRNGYLEALERKLNVSLPNMRIQAYPHIKSRLQTLRNNLEIVNDMLVGKYMSGFSWDHERLCVVADDHVWDKYIKIKKTAARFGKWPFPHYDKLCIIYGKERVMGLQADGIGGENDEEEIKINPSYEAEDDIKGEENVKQIIVLTSFEYEDNVEEIDINTSLETEKLPVSVDVSSFDGGKESVGDKRKRDETSELNETCVETKVASQGITAANEIMDIVTTQMKDLQGLTLDERLLAMSVIGRSAPLSLMFERLDDEGKIRMAQMVANGYIT
nr:hypothetical protein [Tanacetum cinerariifolium]